MNIKTILPMVFLGMVACSQKTYQSIGWQSTPIEVDGLSPEWNLPLKEYDPKLKLNYQFTNDSENLYFCARVSDESVAQQLVRGGLKLELDTLESSKDFPFSISYPVMQGPPQPMARDGEMPTGEKPEQPDFSTDSNREKPEQMDFQPQLLSANEISLKGFNQLQQPQNVPFDKTNGIIAQHYTDEQGILFYELAIPFKTFYKTKIMAQDTLTVFSCNISMSSPQGDRPAPTSGGNDSGMGGPPPGGMGGPPPGGMRPGNDMNEGDRPDMESNNSSSYSIKKTFCLSFQE